MSLCAAGFNKITIFQDDLRLVEDGKMKGDVCGHVDFLYSRPDILAENFLPPEQRNFETDENGKVIFDSLPVLNEKIDIFKIPAITGYILGDSPGHNSILEKLKERFLDNSK